MAKRQTSLVVMVESGASENKIRATSLTTNVEYVETINNRRSSNLLLMMEYTGTPVIQVVGSLDATLMDAYNENSTSEVVSYGTLSSVLEDATPTIAGSIRLLGNAKNKINGVSTIITAEFGVSSANGNLNALLNDATVVSASTNLIDSIVNELLQDASTNLVGQSVIRASLIKALEDALGNADGEVEINGLSAIQLQDGTLFGIGDVVGLRNATLEEQLQNAWTDGVATVEIEGNCILYAGMDAVLTGYAHVGIEGVTTLITDDATLESRLVFVDKNNAVTFNVSIKRSIELETIIKKIRREDVHIRFIFRRDVAKF